MFQRLYSTLLRGGSASALEGTFEILPLVLRRSDNVSGDAPNCPPPAASLHWWTSPGHPLCKLATLAFLLDGYACFPELLRPIPVQSVYQNAPLRSSPDKWVRCDVVHPRTETRLQAPGPPPSPHAQATDSLQAAIHPRQPPVVWRFQVMCPMHRAECIEIALDLPVAVDSALARVAQKLTALDLDFASTIVPVQPQPVSGYATLVLTGDWLEAEGNTVVIYDLRAMGGPMFAQHLCIAASYGDISSIAARFHLANWQAFAFGSQTPVSPGTRFRSVHGGLIKIVQQGTIPSWGCSFEGMLSGRTEWCSECPLYWEGPSQSVLVADFDRTIALRRIPFNCATLRASVSKLLGIAQTRLVLDHPQKGTLENVLHFGEPCSGVVAAREAPTVRDSTNRGFCVFLDPRQVGRQICKLHIMQPEVSADDLARFAGILRSPQGFFTSFCADRATSGRLVVQDGDVITFGFCPIEPASASSIDGPSDSCPPVIDTPQRHDDTPATAEFRLLREPYSTSLADRERIEQIRDEAEADGRVWPYLPADDPFAQEQVAIANDVQFGSGEVCRLVFVILTPGMANETVAVLLTLPATLEDALDAVADARNGHNRQFFPHLGVVQPQPFLDFGTLHALPEWCPDENVVCFNLADWDGRFYTTIMPPRATREDIIHHAGITVPDAVNVLVGTSVDPLADAAWADLTIGCCVSFYPRHMLPGPYFFLHDMLLAAATWATAPAIPAVPASDFDNRICAVCETGCRLVRRLGLDSSPELAIASALDMSDGDLLKQESAPAVYDAALHGWPCHRVFAVAEPADPITGWLLVATASGAVRVNDVCQRLTTFCPDGYRVFLAGVNMQEEFYHPHPGQVVTAAFVLCSPPASIADEDDGEDDDFDQSPDTSSSDPHDPPYAIDGGSRREPDAVDSSGYVAAFFASVGVPSPHDTPALQIGVDDPEPVVAGAHPEARTPVPFLLFTPDYCPEQVTVDLTIPATVRQALDSVQANRSETGQRRFPMLHVVEPQPLVTTAVLLALPDWCRSVYVIIDCSRFLGTVFCLFVSPRMTYEAILTAAGIDVHAPVAVFVHTAPMPLQPGQAVDLQLGYCASITRLPSPPLAMANLHTLLLSSEGWGPFFNVTGRPGQWICLLTDTEPFMFQLHQDRRQSLRADIANALGREAFGLTVVPSAPRITDYFDRGFFASGVGIATYTAGARVGTPHAVYFLDLRPILCDFAWGLAPEGVIQAEPLVARFDSYAPEGCRTQVTGARVEHTDDGLLFHVQTGSILTVDYVLHEFESSQTGDESSDEPSDSADPSDHETSDPDSDHDAVNDQEPSLQEADAVLQDGAVSGPRLVGTCCSVGSSLCLSAYEQFPLIGCRLPYDAQPDSHLARGSDSAVADLHRYVDETGVPPAMREPATPDLFRVPHDDIDIMQPAFVDALLVTLSPGYSPDLSLVPLAMPASVEDACDHLLDVRDEALKRRFPIVVPVVPQPFAACALFVALPAWDPRLILAAFHLPARPERVFSHAVASRVSREALLVTAGFGSGSQVDVFVAGNQLPLQMGEIVDSFVGMTVTIQPHGGSPPVPRLIQGMLASATGWDPQMTFPFVVSPALWLLTDHEPCRFPLEGINAESLRPEIASCLGYALGDMVLQAALSGPDDFEDLGFSCSAVVVASQRFQSLPGNSSIIFLCDLRPLLRGIVWKEATYPALSIAALAALLDIRCPSGFHIVVSGAPQHPGPDGPILELAPGRCIVVELTDGPLGHDPSTGNGILIFEEVPDDPESDAPNPAVLQPRGGDNHTHIVQTPAAGPPLARELRGSPALVAAAHFGAYYCGASRIWVDKWQWGSSQHALLESLPTLASVLNCFAGCQNIPATFLDSAFARFASALTRTVATGYATGPVTGPCSRSAYQDSSCTSTFLAHVGVCVWVLGAWCSGSLAVLLLSAFRLLTCGKLSWFVLVYVLLLLRSVHAVQLPPLPSHANVAVTVPFHDACESDCVNAMHHDMRPILRPLPTPCRQRVLCDDLLHQCLEEATQQHQTLLWQSCHQQEGYPFYEAATLLDALIEHFADTPDQSLQRTIGHRCPYATGSTMESSQSSQSPDVVDLLPWNTCLRLITALAPFRGRALDAFLLELRNACTPGDMYFFSDGSFFPPTSVRHSRAGWAVVCIDPHMDSLALALGCVPDFLMCEGAPLSPYLAECTGLLAAGLIRINAFSHRRAVFCSDCTAAVEAAAGRCAFQVEGIPQAMCSVHAFAQQVFGSLDRYQYTPGHTGIVANELADVASKYAACRRRVSCGLVAMHTRLHFWLSDGATLLPWAAVALQSICGHSDMPPLNTANVGDNSHHQGLSLPQLLEPFMPLHALRAPIVDHGSEGVEDCVSSSHLLCVL
ncbi:hypothetical protein AK812_SmicGene539 [Symbiodinium microadriaticum]|uniref:Uncharacterized protein n=1 Tax=Symbiodinium microadriaticum TaxID=2951 RepID=A0A1Q9F6G0_SYMMI|nr:hypothetical protein AK812_SmicGene539 [Symbiodinium microadriaticum]